MIVVLVISILLAIAVPAWQKSRERTRRVTCFQNLRKIDDAKSNWAMINRKSEGDVPTEEDIAPDFIKGVIPDCPSGGTYTINGVGEKSECSTHGICPNSGE